MKVNKGKHWVNFLPYAGQITKSGSDMELRALRIFELNRKLQNELKDYELAENELFDVAHNEWSIEEITDAKGKSEWREL